MQTLQNIFRYQLMIRSLVSTLLCIGFVCMSACGGEYADPYSYAGHKSVELKEFMRLGDEARGDSVLFGKIRSMAVNSAGQLVVGDWDNSNGYVFSPDGELDGHFGGKGAGPGEFEWMGSTVVGPSDSIFVFDPILSRISAFDPDTYQFDYSISLKSERIGRQSPGDLVGVTERGFIIRYNRNVSLSELAPNSDETRLIGVVMRVNWRGESVDSILGLRLSSNIIAPDASRIISRPFARESMVRLGPNGILYSGWNDGIQIERTGIDAKSYGSIQWPHDPVPVTEEDIEDVMEGRDLTARQMMLGANLATTWPAYRTFVVDDESRVWVQLFYAKDAPLAKGLIVDGEGFAVGEVDLPVGVVLMAIRSGRAYGQFEDPDTGAPLVVGYEIIGL